VTHRMTSLLGRISFAKVSPVSTLATLEGVGIQGSTMLYGMSLKEGIEWGEMCLSEVSCRRLMVLMETMMIEGAIRTLGSGTRGEVTREGMRIGMVPLIRENLI
jgi:hypothetical protein